jgi:hypothetical protein
LNGLFSIQGCGWFCQLLVQNLISTLNGLFRSLSKFYELNDFFFNLVSDFSQFDGQSCSDDRITHASKSRLEPTFWVDRSNPPQWLTNWGGRFRIVDRSLLSDQDRLDTEFSNGINTSLFRCSGSCELSNPTQPNRTEPVPLRVVFHDCALKRRNVFVGHHHLLLRERNRRQRNQCNRTEPVALRVVFHDCALKRRNVFVGHHIAQRSWSMETSICSTYSLI